MHDLIVINTLAGALAVALVFGWITQRLGLSTLVGYMLAGIAVGPFTPGFVADSSTVQLALRRSGRTVEYRRLCRFCEALGRSRGTAPSIRIEVILLRALFVRLCALRGSRIVADYHATRRRFRNSFPLGPLSGSVASHTAVSAPCSTLLVAFEPPMSVRTHPGHAALTSTLDPSVAAANMHVNALSAVLESR